MTIKAILFDLAGVLHEGARPLAGAVQAVEQARAAGLGVRFVTNTSRTTRRTLLGRLREMGFAVEEAEIFTAPLAARAYIETRGWRPFLLVHPDLEQEFADLDTHRPDTVVVGDAAEDFSYANLNLAFRLLMKGAPLIAIGTNRYFREADGLSLDAGPFVRALEYASGASAVVVGKPAQAFFFAAVQDLACKPEEVAMIGDDVAADVVGACQSGLYGYLVQTGKFQAGDENQVPGERARLVRDVGEAVAVILASRGA